MAGQMSFGEAGSTCPVTMGGDGRLVSSAMEQKSGQSWAAGGPKHVGTRDFFFFSVGNLRRIH